MSSTTGESTGGKFSKEEREAMKQRAAEMRTEAKRLKGEEKLAAQRTDAEQAIASLPSGDRELALRIHELVLGASPALTPKTWYGMPAYAKDDKIVAFFQAADKFKARYSTLGFNDPAKLDDGAFWPTSFAVTPDLTDADAAQIVALVQRAVA